MMQILKVIKTYWVSLLCGVVAAGAVTVGVMGMSSDTAVKKMKKQLSQAGASSINSLRSDPKNEQIIEREKRRGELFQEEYQKTLDVALEINKREPLMTGVFPKYDSPVRAYEYQEAYAEAVRTLHTELQGGMLPTEAEIQEEAQNVEDLLLLEAEQKAEESGEEVSGTNRRSTGRSSRSLGTGGRLAPSGGGRMPPTYGGGRTPPQMAGGGRMPPHMAGGRNAPRGMGAGYAPQTPTISAAARTGEPKYDPVYRARVAKAKSILCYYDADTFHVSPIVTSPTAPQPEEMWLAQVSLWVQNDIVDAIAKLNDAAAGRVKEGDPSVQDVPVKRLVRVRVASYETPQGRLQIPSISDVPEMDPSFTGRLGNDMFDVIRFRVEVVMDQRDILELIDEISRVNFYQCLNVDYEIVDRNIALEMGYFYGTDPVVQVSLDFEGYMARDVYAPIMPALIKKNLGIEGGGEEEG